MAQCYEFPAHDGAPLYGFWLLFGSLMAISIVLGLAAIQRRHLARHRAWMMRGYALGLGASTQALTLGICEIAYGTPGEVGRGLPDGRRLGDQPHAGRADRPPVCCSAGVMPLSDKPAFVEHRAGAGSGRHG
jgi:hypothetical protein